MSKIMDVAETLAKEKQKEFTYYTDLCQSASVISLINSEIKILYSARGFCRALARVSGFFSEGGGGVKLYYVILC